MKKALGAAAVAAMLLAALMWWKSAPRAPHSAAAPEVAARALVDDAGTPRPAPDRQADVIAPDRRAVVSAPVPRTALAPSKDGSRFAAPAPAAGNAPERPAEAPELIEFEPLVAPVPPPPVPPAAAPAVAAPVAIEREFPPAAPVARTPPAPSNAELAAVQGVVRRYEETYGELDVNAVAEIWPSVDSRGLSRLFRGIERQDLQFETCAYAVADARATATCAGSLTYVPRVGSTTPRTDRHTWSIQLERAGQRRQIVSVTAQ
jgi:hypothetical protein